MFSCTSAFLIKPPSSKASFFMLFSALLLLSGCRDRYQEGHDAGFIDGFIAGSKSSDESCEQKIENAKEMCEQNSRPSFSSYSTEVCGGSGTSVNGKFYPAGKTGCVRVFTDGRVERY